MRPHGVECRIAQSKQKPNLGYVTFVTRQNDAVARRGCRTDP